MFSNHQQRVMQIAQAQQDAVRAQAEAEKPPSPTPSPPAPVPAPAPAQAPATVLQQQNGQETSDAQSITELAKKRGRNALRIDLSTGMGGTGGGVGLGIPTG
jgi:hypothetical protein